MTTAPMFAAMALASATTLSFAALPSIDQRRAAIARHEIAVHVHEQWIRDPFVVNHEGWFYYTGTTAAQEPDKVIGIPLWRSRDLADWEKLPRLWSIGESRWLGEARTVKNPSRPVHVWAPEMILFGGRWVVAHTSSAEIANLLTTSGPELAGPLREPMGARLGRRHDPSFYSEGNVLWLVWGCAEVAPLLPDLDGFASPPVRIGPSNRKMGHEGCLIRRIGDKYVLFGTAWSTDRMRKGSYNLYYCTADRITGPYGPRRFAGRFLGHGTPFQDSQGRWWSTAFFNANFPELPSEGIGHRDLSADAQTINPKGLTLVPLDVRFADGDVRVRAKDPRYASPGPDEAQRF